MKNLKMLLPVVLFVLFLVVLEIWFWTSTDECGLGFGIITYFILFPLTIFVLSLIYSLKTKNKYKYFLILFFGLAIMLFEYTTYSLGNMLSFDKINMPDISLFLEYGVISLIGILLGNLKKDKKHSKE